MTRGQVGKSYQILRNAHRIEESSGKLRPGDSVRMSEVRSTMTVANSYTHRTHYCCYSLAPP